MKKATSLESVADSVVFLLGDRAASITGHCDLTASVQVGTEVFLGSRVSIIPHVKIGDKAYIGAGSVVLRDVAAGIKVVGAPARRIG